MSRSRSSAARALSTPESYLKCDIDINKEIALKGVQDLVGSYQRLDIFQVHVNQTPIKPVHLYTQEPIATEPTVADGTSDEPLI